jgi:hypothetical protein
MLLLQTCGAIVKIGGSHQWKSIFPLLPNTQICGCGWTSPATTLPNSILNIILKTHFYFRDAWNENIVVIIF